MDNSNQQDPPAGTPEGSIPIDPDVGFAPHITDDFLDSYGESSVFVTAAVDCLTYRFVRVLVKAGKLPQEHHTPQYGTPEMREALEQLLSKLASCGMDKPPVVLMRSAVGRSEPRAFQDAAGAILGVGLVGNWFRELEHENYSGARSLLVAH
ncbi:hypothetical protein GCM10027285_10090 [Oleiagrimonas citrea]|uniref:Uncharacterized protein n=1 Tax=Oleiagrimonas citrea TaxID=1665687 RepID=A0A846ZLF2_9GAMM|nr:hypothetical protein [Oleiagrimonas citrea]NKZ38429.1 hypothetical protein [Oleiagrimonas citrea]